MLPFCFTYGMDDTRYDPCNPTIHVDAETFEAARLLAQDKLNEIVRLENREKWCFESGSWDGDGKWVHYPATNRTGRLIGKGWEVKPVKLRSGKPFSFPVDLPRQKEFAEAIAAVISAPLLQVIESAPVMANLFSSTSIPDGGPSIPMRFIGKTVYEDPTAVAAAALPPLI